VIPLLPAAERLLGELTRRFCAERGREAAIDSLVDSVERASARYLADGGVFYDAPSPFLSMLRAGWRWAEKGRPIFSSCLNAPAALNLKLCQVLVRRSGEWLRIGLSWDMFSALSPFQVMCMPLMPKARQQFLMLNPGASAKHLGNNVGFKFFHSKDADFILKQGSIKIGRLSEYRAMEKDTLRDDGEGIARTNINGTVRLSDVHPSQGIHNVELFQGRHPSQIIIKNSTYTKHYEGYVHCFSYENTYSTLSRLP